MIGRPLVKSFQLLGSRVISPIKEYFLPKQFKFITLSPQQNLQFKSLPMEEWRSGKQQQEEIGKAKLLGFFLLCFFIGDWVYTFKHNQNVMYYYFVNYPLAMKLLETTISQTELALKPFVEIMPKEKYQILQLWARIKNALFNTEQNTKVKNENVQKLKQEIDQIDSKLK